MRIISFTGHAGAGKDAAAKTLIEEFGFTRLAFADPMREAMLKLNPFIACECNGCDKISLQEIVNELGWDAAKRQYPEIRRLLQIYGTECGRDVFGADCWVDAAFRNLDRGKDYVITDCRFPNEAARIRAEGGIVVKIHRPGVGPVNSHTSDAGLPDELIDCTIDNNRTLDDLANCVRFIVKLVTKYSETF